MLGLRHLALKVRDIRRSVEFYTEILGMRMDWQPDERNAYLTSGADNLALHQWEAPEADLTGAGSSLDHFGFLVSRPEEVDEWAVHLAAKGVPLIQAPRTHRDGSRSLYFRDPDDNLVQLLFHPHISRP
ncbi:MAG: VOC family protein [Acidobacteriota bacterium]|jgi:catechol 2,3-dioxygenase-like lactoylglutathione lyase family enzyme